MVQVAGTLTQEAASPTWEREVGRQAQAEVAVIERAGVGPVLWVEEASPEVQVEVAASLAA